MAGNSGGKRAKERREKLRNDFFKGVPHWQIEIERGYFSAPRTLPLLLALLKSKEISTGEPPTMVYVELFSRNMGEGLIEMVGEDEHAFAAGYQGNRATRTWVERMSVLEANGFIKTAKVGNRRFGLVLLVHPAVVIEHLLERKKVSHDWLAAYRKRQEEIGEISAEEVRNRGASNVLVNLADALSKKNS